MQHHYFDGNNKDTYTHAQPQSRSTQSIRRSGRFGDGWLGRVRIGTSMTVLHPPFAGSASFGFDEQMLTSPG
jgi:hypothetical protein